MSLFLCQLYLKYASICIRATVLFLWVSCLSSLGPGFVFVIEFRICLNNAGENSSISLGLYRGTPPLL